MKNNNQLYVVSLRNYGGDEKKFSSIQPFGVYTTFAKAKKAGVDLLKTFGAGLIPRYIRTESNPTVCGGQKHWTMEASYWERKGVGKVHHLCSVSIDSMPIETDTTLARWSKSKWFRYEQNQHAAYCEMMHGIRVALKHSVSGDQLFDTLVSMMRRVHEIVRPNQEFILDTSMRGVIK